MKPYVIGLHYVKPLLCFIWKYCNLSEYTSLHLLQSNKALSPSNSSFSYGRFNQVSKNIIYTPTMPIAHSMALYVSWHICFFSLHMQNGSYFVLSVICWLNPSHRCPPSWSWDIAQCQCRSVEVILIMCHKSLMCLYNFHKFHQGQSFIYKYFKATLNI